MKNNKRGYMMPQNSLTEQEAIHLIDSLPTVYKEGEYASQHDRTLRAIWRTQLPLEAKARLNARFLAKVRY